VGRERQRPVNNPPELLLLIANVNQEQYSAKARNYQGFR
jgi:hypothetical protein